MLDPVRGGSDAGIGERSALEGAKEEAGAASASHAKSPVRKETKRRAPV